jgi:hypothetical protein
MFESKERLAEEIQGLLLTLQRESGAEEACLVDRKGVLFGTETAAPSLAAHLARHTEELFRLPETLKEDGPQEDLFEGWRGEGVLLAFINRKVALALGCPDPEGAKEAIRQPLEALSDRLFRWNASYRIDPKGRGLFFGSPSLDLVSVGAAPGERT